MRTVGILLLFGLCTLIGLRAAAKKTARTERIRSLKQALLRFSDAFSGGMPLPAIAQEGEGAFFDALRAYLAAQADGQGEQRAAALACRDCSDDALHAALLLFFGGLSVCPRAEIRLRINALSAALNDAAAAAAEDGKRARVIRAVGVLTGAALAVLLI